MNETQQTLRTLRAFGILLCVFAVILIVVSIMQYRMMNEEPVVDQVMASKMAELETGQKEYARRLKQLEKASETIGATHKVVVALAERVEQAHQEYELTLLADSVADFSGIQGQKGWRYGYYTTPLTQRDFHELPVFDGSQWRQDANSACRKNQHLYLSMLRSHPSGGRCTKKANHEQKWTVRRWVCSAEEMATIVGSSSQSHHEGDGALVILVIDGKAVYRRQMQGSSRSTEDFTIHASLRKGSVVDLVTSPGDDCKGDWTNFSAQIWAKQPKSEDHASTTQGSLDSPTP